MRRLVLCCLTAALCSVMSLPASAALTFYVNSPTANSSQWSSAVAGLGGTINTSVNFEGELVDQPLNPLAYATEGVTLDAVGFSSGSDPALIVNNSGPGGFNNTSPVTSPGEGLYSQSNYLFKANVGAGSLTINFTDAPVGGVGFFIIDLFRRVAANDADKVSISVFDGLNGTGNNLGSAVGLGFNFQTNNVYFMGVTSTVNEIRSVVFTDPGGATDQIGIDNIRFATLSAPVPEPSSIVLLVMGAGMVAFYARKRKSALPN